VSNTPPCPPAAPDAKIYVAYGEVAIADNGTCSLIEAIINARATRAGHGRRAQVAQLLPAAGHRVDDRP